MENQEKNFLEFKKEFQELAKKYNFKGYAVMIEEVALEKEHDIPHFNGSATLSSTYKDDEKPTDTEALGLIQAWQNFEK